MERDPVSTEWVEEVLFTQGKDLLDNFKQVLLQAQKSVDLETYIFAEDEQGEQIATLLAQAAKRGLRVRILVDGFGSALFPGKFYQRFKQSGIELRIFRPPPWRVLYLLHRWGLPQFIFRWFESLAKIAKRDHRKLIVVDGTTAYVGSLNIMNPSWQESGVRVKGKAVSLLVDLFEKVWQDCEGDSQSLAPFSDGSGRLGVFPIRYHYDYRSGRASLKQLVQAFKAAQHRIWLINAYFFPPFSIWRALFSAARRGVDCRLVVPHRSDLWFVPYLTRLFYRPLLMAGVKIFEYQRKTLHEKTLLIDDLGMVGSTNLNGLTFSNNLELDIILSKRHNLVKLEAHMLTLMGDAHCVELAS